ncbi:AMP-binding protein [Caldisphaera sp.]|uniref:AMP-binding protein n=1 Tax=Caldisphaera sp. TaxID=2060322 RepID=UPI0025C3F609|nr:AMP-binding protein [Caldisphaera sp.]
MSGEDKELSLLLSEINEDNSIRLMKKFNKIMRWVIADFPKFVSHKYPDKHGLIYYGFNNVENKYTYKELDSLSNRFANFLIENGLKDYDRVAIHSFNSDYFVISMFGTYKAKGVLVPINYLLTGKDVIYQINNSESKFYLLDDSFYSQIKDVLPEFNYVKKFVALNKKDKINNEKFVDFNDILKNYSDKEPDKILNIWDPVTIMYTSGTESLPKGVIHTNQSLISQYVSVIISGDFQSKDIVINALPLYHTAQNAVLTVGVWLGATNIVLPKGDIQLIMEAIQKYKANSMFAPPTVWIGIVNHPDFKKYDLSSIEKIYYGAAIMPVEVLNRLRKEFPNAKFVNYYGQTELAPAHTALLPEDHEIKPGTAGKELLNMMTELMDEQGNIIKEPYKAGEIVGRGPHTMIGYLKNPEKTMEAFKYDWFHSGDIGMWDKDHYLYVIDRKKDMIKTGGENVSSREVEEVIYKHPAVKEVAVIGLPDEKWIEKVTAVVVLKDNYEKSEELKKEIMEFARNNLAHFKAPKEIIFVDSLPKSPSGKILKRELREQFKSRKEFKEKM